jgi:hypothetical protein
MKSRLGHADIQQAWRTYEMHTKCLGIKHEMRPFGKGMNKWEGKY